MIKNSPVRFADIFQKLEEYYHNKPDENWQTVLSLLLSSLDSEIQF